MGTDARAVLKLLALLGLGDGEHWVEGGWGVDALLGHQTRDHGDLDLAIDETVAPFACQTLVEDGFVVIHQDPPGFVSYAAEDGRVVDLCVTAADRYGDRWNLKRVVGSGEPDYPYDGFTYGWIAGMRVPCIGPQVQMDHHLGYTPEDVDRIDMDHLRERFDVVVPQALC